MALLQQYARKRERFLHVRAELRDQMQSLRVWPSQRGGVGGGWRLLCRCP